MVPFIFRSPPPHFFFAFLLFLFQLTVECSQYIAPINSLQAAIKAGGSWLADFVIRTRFELLAFNWCIGETVALAWVFLWLNRRSNDHFFLSMLTPPSLPRFRFVFSILLLAVTLLDADFKVQDTMNVTFVTNSTCICLGHCGCTCTDETPVEKCIDVEANDPVPSDRGGGFSLSGLFDSLGLSLGAGLGLLFTILILLCLCCCCTRCCAGCCATCKQCFRCPQSGQRQDARSDGKAARPPRPGPLAMVAQIVLALLTFVLFPFAVLAAGVNALWRRRTFHKRTTPAGQPPLSDFDAPPEDLLVSRSAQPTGVPADLRDLLVHRTVFLNLSSVSPAVRQYLAQPGRQCSLKGSLSAVRVLMGDQRPQVCYTFTIDGHEAQTCLVSASGALRSLMPPRLIVAAAFQHTLDAAQARRLLSLKPLYPCLNA